jgi:hypothetical protein
MIAVARTRAPGIRFIKSAAEDLSAPAATFDLITIGNAFPPDAPRRRGRPRPPVAPARRVPGPGLGRLPWPFEQHREPWQDVLREAMERWQPADRIPDGYEENRAARPDLAVLADAGFELAGRQEFPVARSWTLDELVGFLASTSTHSAAALGDRAQDFDADLRRSLLAHNPAAEYPHTLTFSCELARSPAEPRSPT